MTAIANAFAEVTTEQTHTGDTVFTDVPGAEITSGNFVTGQKYLLLVGYSARHSSSNGQGRVRVAHGTTGFADSEYSFEPVNAASRIRKLWFHVWTAVSGEKVVLQQATDAGANTTGVDQCVLWAARLDADLIENTDWFFNHNSTSTDLTATFASGASVTWTPGTASDIWLLMTMAQHNPAVVTVQYESRMDLSGGTAFTGGLNSIEPEDATNDLAFFSYARAISLPASSHTLAEQSREETDSAGTREHSKAFALNLSKFKDVSQSFAGSLSALNTGTAWEDPLSALSHTKTVDGDVLCLVCDIDDHASLGTTFGHRMQVDNVDQPDTQGTDNYDYRGTLNDSTDQESFSMFSREAITANITLDHDAYNKASGAGMTYTDRAAVVFSMELAAVAAANPVFEMRVPEFA